MEERSVDSTAIVSGMYEAFDRCGPSALWHLMDPAISFAEPPVYRLPYAGFHSGPRSVATVLSRHDAELWKDFRAVPEALVETGESVVVLGFFKGVGTHTGEPICAPFVHECFLREGKLARVRSYPGAVLAMGVPD